LMAAAVQAAIRERASNRCISGIAAAVAGQVVTRISTGQAAAPQQPAARAKERRRDPAEEADDPVELLASLRAHRCAVRAKKKERRKAAKRAATGDDSAAGNCADHVGGSAVTPALALQSLEAPALATAGEPPGILAPSVLAPGVLPDQADSALNRDELSNSERSAPSTARPAASEISAGVLPGRYTANTTARPQPYRGGGKPTAQGNGGRW
jgi:hypothetical protein